jgi:myosin heavy subunit
MIESGRGSVFVKTLDSRAAKTTADSLSMGIYMAIFEVILKIINASLKSVTSVKSEAGIETFCGILDIFGFEVFDFNYFEQLCINYCNEKIHQYFIKKVIFMEQEEYVREGVSFIGNTFTDNSLCLEIIEGSRVKPGVLSLLDDECRMGKVDDSKYLVTLCASMSKVCGCLAPQERRVLLLYCIYYVQRGYRL